MQSVAFVARGPGMFCSSGTAALVIVFRPVRAHAGRSGRDRHFRAQGDARQPSQWVPVYPAEGAGCALRPPALPRRPSDKLRISGGAEVNNQASVFTETMNVPALMKCQSGSPR